MKRCFPFQYPSKIEKTPFASLFHVEHNLNYVRVQVERLHFVGRYQCERLGESSRPARYSLVYICTPRHTRLRCLWEIRPSESARGRDAVTGETRNREIESGRPPTGGPVRSARKEHRSSRVSRSYGQFRLPSREEPSVFFGGFDSESTVKGTYFTHGIGWRVEVWPLRLLLHACMLHGKLLPLLCLWADSCRHGCCLYYLLIMPTQIVAVIVSFGTGSIVGMFPLSAASFAPPLGTLFHGPMRSAIRKKHNIPGNDCEDCLIVWWCACCALAQVLSCICPAFGQRH